MSSMLHFRFKLAELARPVTTRLPRGRHSLAKLLMGPAASYKADPFFKASLRDRSRVIFDRRLQSWVILDVGDWACRQHYIKGIYREQDVPTLIRSYLREGDTFIDVGANRGVHTLCAARQVGRSGRVYAFEPLPAAYKVLEAHLTANMLDNTVAYNGGLGDEPATLQLNILSDDHSGTCTFRDDATTVSGVSVPVWRLADLLGDMPIKGRCLVKIDTEGFDHRVIKGMGPLLDRPDIAVWCEVTDEWLRRTGSSAQELFDDMERRGFGAYKSSLTFKSLTEQILDLSLLTAPLSAFQYDVLFARGDLPHDLRGH